MLSEKERIDLKEKYYKRNYITMLLEAFCVNFAFSIFSYTTVFPVYVQNITSNSFFVALVAVIYYGCSYGSSILSCLVGLNAKSPKLSLIHICRDPGRMRGQDSGNYYGCTGNHYCGGRFRRDGCGSQ